MKRLAAVLPIAAVTVALLAGCGTASGSKGPDPVDLTDSTIVTALCGDNAQEILDEVQPAADAKPTSGHRKELEDWGLTKKEYKDDTFVAKIIDQLEKQVKVECGADGASPTPSATPTGDEKPVSDAIKALLDASRAPTDACLAIVKEQLGKAAVVNGVYTVSAPPAMVGPGKDDLKVKFGDAEALWWSNALDLSLQGNTPEEKKADLELKICTHAPVGVALRHLIANLTLDDGTQVINLQKTDWLDEGLVPQSKLNDQVEEYIPLLYLDEHEQSLSEDKLYQMSATAAREYEEMASKLVYFIEHFELGQVMPINSRHSYEIVGGGLSLDQMPEIRVTTALDARPALVFYLTDKTTECAPLLVLGFNVGDSRPELATEGYTCDQVNPPPVECDSAHPCGTHGCPEGQWWNGYTCLQGKLPGDDVVYTDGNWSVEGNDSYTSGSEGTGTGTSGNAGTNGTKGSGTDGKADGAETGTTTATGGNSTDAVTTDQTTTVDNPGGKMEGEPQ